jgi:peptidoglycan/LPS O-acetylase OafA/YrhL
MDNELFKQKMLLIVGTMFTGISAAIFLDALAAASPSMPKSEGLAYGLPLLLAIFLTLINAGILCCFTGGKKQPIVCRTMLGLAIICILLVFVIALGNAGT